MQLNIQPNGMKNIDASLPDTSSPRAFNLTAFDSDSGKKISIQGKSFFEVIPRLERIVDKIVISEFHSHSY